MTDTQISLDKKFIYTLMSVLLFAALGTIGYMISWNRDDLAHKILVLEKLETVAVRISKLEIAVESGILPEAQWRVKQLEEEIQAHMLYHRHSNGNGPSRVSP